MNSVILRSPDGSLTTRIQLHVRFPSGLFVGGLWLEMQHRMIGANTPWEQQMFTASSTMEVSITNVEDGFTYDLRLRTVDQQGKISGWVTREAYFVIGKTLPPPDPTNLRLNGDQLTWLYPNAPPDFPGFVVRAQVGVRSSWADAMPLHDGVVTQSRFLLFADTGVRTYLVKAVDTTWDESVGAAALSVNRGTIPDADEELW